MSDTPALPSVLADLPMHTQINGKDAEWTPEIWQLWYTHVEVADPKLYDTHGIVKTANYFTPRPYQNAYDRGDTKEGFTFVCGRHVYQYVIGGGSPFRVSHAR